MISLETLSQELDRYILDWEDTNPRTDEDIAFLEKESKRIGELIHQYFIAVMQDIKSYSKLYLELEEIVAKSFQLQTTRFYERAFFEDLFEKIFKHLYTYLKTHFPIIYLEIANNPKHLPDPESILTHYQLTDQEWQIVLKDDQNFDLLRELFNKNRKTEYFNHDLLDPYFLELFPDLGGLAYALSGYPNNFFKDIKDRAIIQELIKYYQTLYQQHKRLSIKTKDLEQILEQLTTNPHLQILEFTPEHFPELLANSSPEEQIDLVTNISDPELIVDAVLTEGENQTIDAYLNKWRNYFEPDSKYYEDLVTSFWNSKNLYAKEQIKKIVQQNLREGILLPIEEIILKQKLSYTLKKYAHTLIAGIIVEQHFHLAELGKDVNQQREELIKDLNKKLKEIHYPLVFRLDDLAASFKLKYLEDCFNSFTNFFSDLLSSPGSHNLWLEVISKQLPLLRKCLLLSETAEEEIQNVKEEPYNNQIKDILSTALNWVIMVARSFLDNILFVKEETDQKFKSNLTRLLNNPFFQETPFTSYFENELKDNQSHYNELRERIQEVGAKELTLLNQFLKEYDLLIEQLKETKEVINTRNKRENFLKGIIFSQGTVSLSKKFLIRSVHYSVPFSQLIEHLEKDNQDRVFFKKELIETQERIEAFLSKWHKTFVDEEQADVNAILQNLDYLARYLERISDSAIELIEPSKYLIQFYHENQEFDPLVGL